jgi:hypothetical protein
LLARLPRLKGSTEIEGAPTHISRISPDARGKITNDKGLAENPWAFTSALVGASAALSFCAKPRWSINNKGIGLWLDLASNIFAASIMVCPDSRFDYG